MAETLQFLSKTVNAWDTIPNSDKMVMLLGYNYTGRSTFAELIKKYQFGVKNESLIFQKDKYTLENIISSKSIKVQTILPLLYKQANQLENNKDSLSIIDVPAYSLSPQTKKWTLYQQKLTWTLMSQKKSEVGFLLFIEQKNTRSSINSWIKTLLSFLDMFKEYPNQFLNSVGWVITKCGPEITEEAISKRLQLMQVAMKKQKNIDGDLVEKLFTSILQNKRYFIFRKPTGNQSEEQQIKNLYKELSKVPHYKFKKEHLKDIIWTTEQNNLFELYFEQGNNYFTSLLSYVNQCLLLERWDTQSILALRHKHLKNIPKDDLYISRFIKSKFKGRADKFDLSLLIKSVSEIIKFCESGVNNAEKAELKLQKILEMLPDFPFFFEHQADENLNLFQAIYQNQNFKEYIRSAKQINKQPLIQFFNQLTEKFCQKLTKIQSQNDNQDFYEACIDLLENATNLKIEFAQFLEDCKSNVLRFRNTKQMLQKIIQDLGNVKEQSKIFELILKVSNILRKQGYFKEAAKYYKIILCPGDVIDCYQKIQNESQQEARQFIEYMTQQYLFESAKKMCYLKSSKFIKKRDIFGKQLRGIFEAERKFILQGVQENVLEKQIKIENKQIQNLRREVKQIVVKLQN